MRTTAFALAFFGLGCATPRLAAVPATPADVPSLNAALEKFYRATSVADLSSAVSDAQKAGPASGGFHEIAARLAQLQGHPDEKFDHELLALTDPDYDAVQILLEAIGTDELTYPQRGRLAELLRSLAGHHPSEQVRDVAKLRLARLVSEDGRTAERDALIASLPGRLEWAIVGPFDNDQGRAFDLELEPEIVPRVYERYRGRAGELSWRRSAPLDPLGQLDFGELMAPSKWQVAYAQAELDVLEAGPQLLLLTSTDPVRVWIDGKVVFSERITLDRHQAEHLTIRLSLNAGKHRLLIKSGQTEGNWRLAARVVPFKGVAEAITLGSAEGTWPMRKIEPAARWRSLHTRWALHSIGGVLPIQLADAALEEAPSTSAGSGSSIDSRLQRFEALLAEKETGRAGDTIEGLDAALGEQLPYLRLRHARFLGEQQFSQRERELLRGLVRTAPRMTEAADRLASIYETEGWVEEALRLHQDLAARAQPTPLRLEARAGVLEKLFRITEAKSEYQRLRAWSPGRSTGHYKLSAIAYSEGDFERQARFLFELLERWPISTWTLRLLSGVARLRGDANEAERIFAQLEALCPGSSDPWVGRGELAAEQGRPEEAKRAWRRALALNPDQPTLAKRLEELGAEERVGWLTDVPTLAQLQSAVKDGAKLEAQAGSGGVYLWDDEVVVLGSDGSTVRVATVMIRIFNAEGAEQSVKRALPATGALRLIHAFTVDPSGAVAQASERNREVFFRGLQPGSTLVLQYRIDAPPSPLLGAYFTDRHTFQVAGFGKLRSRYVVWMPAGMPFHPATVGAVTFVKTAQQTQQRLEWLASGVESLKVEKGMPAQAELATGLQLTTVPDWKTWLAWWRAILASSFETSPELVALAKKLGEGATTPLEKLERIQEWLQGEIRYQQDYESFIAGWKPHPAPRVLERRYGDCKDKAVLFVTLARQLGVEARIALLMTRGEGVINRSLPMQQFNHAVVYVPMQRGLVSDHFYDPTSAWSDLGVMPVPDTETPMLVIDSSEEGFSWQTAHNRSGVNRAETKIDLKLDATGGATGVMTVEQTGLFSAYSRSASGYQGSLREWLTFLTPGELTGNSFDRVEEVENKSLRKPATLTAHFASPSALKKDGAVWLLEAASVQIPMDDIFGPAVREAAVVFPAPLTLRRTTTIELGEGLKVARLPPPLGGISECMSHFTEATLESGKLVIRSGFELTCERIPASEFQKYRAMYKELTRTLGRQIVLEEVPVAKPRDSSAPIACRP